MARLPATRGSSRASVTTSGSWVATTCWQKECDSGVSRQVAHGSGRPTAPGKPLPLGLHQAHQRHRYGERVLDQARVAVEGPVEERTGRSRRGDRLGHRVRPVSGDDG